MFTSRTPQEIIDTLNHTISNCVLEIPQNLQCSITNNTLTVKKNSIITLPAEVYTTYKTTADFTRDLSTLADGDYIIFASTSGIQVPRLKSVIGSGTSLPEDDSTFSVYFIPSENKIYRWTEGEWHNWPVAYPICEVSVINGAANFKQDSNSNDIIFNGACYVGHHVVVYPNIIALEPAGIIDNGNLNSIISKQQSLTILNITSDIRVVGTNSTGGASVWSYYHIVDNINNYTWPYSGDRVYDSSTNKMHALNASAVRHVTPLLYCTKSGDFLTKFDVIKPIRAATVDMLDKVQVQAAGAYHEPKNNTVLFSTWINSGDITLSEPYTNFEYLAVIYTNDTNTECGIRILPVSIFESVMSLNEYNIVQLIEGFSGAYWKIKSNAGGSTSQLLKYDQDQYIGIRAVIGYNKKEA